MRWQTKQDANTGEVETETQILHYLGTESIQALVKFHFILTPHFIQTNALILK
jgi:hypothetical protein